MTSPMKADIANAPGKTDIVAIAHQLGAQFAKTRGRKRRE